ncbi:MAG TPA: ATP-binding cassette domain-containing protein [Candidatus Hydrogenedentes bacterium]|nr:ATP-binding cassette domain-containing protein [Candidatus Hydrogenedentota bacterium]HOS02554.1 ATP-binding cassette domain-containing protein [Candidatus Hydrogenedentota bacterium]
MIKADRLTMHYGPVQALKDVSFEVKQGEIVGLLGPNGAGKSTTMKVLTTYLHPTKGTAFVGGIDVLKDPLGVRKIIGYLPEILPLYMDMEVRGYLTFVGKARGLSGGRLKERIDVALDECGLRPMYRKVIRELSKGYKQRTALAQALIHDPSIIILDEPTSGLDPHQIVEIRQLIKNLAAGKTVILSTHILQEVEATADRIVIISNGRIVGDGTIDELRDEVKKEERIRVSVSGDKTETQRLLSGMSGARKVEPIAGESGFAAFMVHGAPGAQLWKEVGQLARLKNWEVRELSDHPLTLEETFLSLTERAASPAAKRAES